MMNVAIVNAVYPPEPVVSAQIGRDLALHLAQGGARVTVLCPFPSRPLGVDYAEFRSVGRPDIRVEDGVEVVRLPSFTAPRSRLLPRMRENWSFGCHVCRYMRERLPDVDVVYANTWPLLSQALISRHCSQRSIPLVFHIQDIYPESLLGKFPRFCRAAVVAPLIVVDRWTVRRATRVVVISENMRRTYEESRGLTPGRLVTILDWVDESLFACLPSRGAACARYGVREDRFTFLYLGNIGPVAGVERLIEAFSAAHMKDAQLVVAGDGSAKTGCVQLAKRMGGDGVRFISDPDAKNVPLLQSLAHVCLLPLRKGAGMSSIPSKLMAYLLSAKPVLATVDAESDTARCVREAKCGWVGEPEDANWLTEKMREVAALSADTLTGIGANGRDYGMRHFSKTTGVQQLAKVVLEVRPIRSS